MRVVFALVLFMLPLTARSVDVYGVLDHTSDPTVRGDSTDSLGVRALHQVRPGLDIDVSIFPLIMTDRGYKHDKEVVFSVRIQQKLFSFWR